MAANWQQWMPLYINKIRGSMFFNALPDAGKVGYIFLLMAQWESEDGSLPSAPEELAELSSLGDRWEEIGPKILRKFTALESGRLRNPVLHSEWEKARKVYEARATHAQKVNKKHTEAVTGAVSGTVNDTVTAPVTGTHIHKQEHKQKETTTPAAFVLPDFIDGGAWAGFLEVRKRKRAPNTQRALEGIVRELENLRARGFDANAVLDQSTMRGWSGVFELKGSVQQPKADPLAGMTFANRRTQ